MQTPMQRSQAQMHSQQQQMHKHQQQIQQGIDSRRHQRQQSEMLRQRESMWAMHRRNDEVLRTMAQQRRTATLQSSRPYRDSTSWTQFRLENRITEAKTHPVRGFFVLMMTVALTIVAGALIGSIFHSQFAVVTTWIVGVITTYHFTRAAWGR